MSHPIRQVPFSLPSPGPEIEFTTLARIFRRGGDREFLRPQRLSFDLLYRVERGATVHRVDFAAHALEPGAVLWVRAGQVHEWGDRRELAGPVVMFPPHSVDPGSAEQIGRSGFDLRNSWSAGEVDRSGAWAAWASLTAPEPPGLDAPARSHLRRHALTALLLRITARTGDLADSKDDHDDDTLYWFRAEVEARFASTHMVRDYAQRLGYPTRTLTRAAAAAGTTPKAIIDARIILEACRLLVFTAWPIADVGREVGFDDPSNFAAYFRQRTGSTPHRFRTAARPDHRTPTTHAAPSGPPGR